MLAILSMFMIGTIWLIMRMIMHVVMIMLMIMIMFMIIIVIFQTILCIIELIERDIPKLRIKIFSYLIMTMDLLFPFRIFNMTMWKTYLFQTILIITYEFIAKRCCTITWIWIIIMWLMMMIARLRHQTMRMIAGVKHKVHNDVYRKTSDSYNQHCQRLSNKLLVNDSDCGFINHKYG